MPARPQAPSLAERIRLEETLIRRLPEKKVSRAAAEEFDLDEVLAEVDHMLAQTTDERPLVDVIYFNVVEQFEARDCDEHPERRNEWPDKRAPEHIKKIWKLEQRLTVEVGDLASFYGPMYQTWPVRLYAFKRLAAFLGWTGHAGDLSESQQTILRSIYCRAAQIAAEHLPDAEYKRRLLDWSDPIAPALNRADIDLPPGRPAGDPLAKEAVLVLADVFDHKNRRGAIEQQMLLSHQPDVAPPENLSRMRPFPRVLLKADCDGTLIGHEYSMAILSAFCGHHLFVESSTKSQFHKFNYWHKRERATGGSRDTERPVVTSLLIPVQIVNALIQIINRLDRNSGSSIYCPNDRCFKAAWKRYLELVPDEVDRVLAIEGEALVLKPIKLGVLLSTKTVNAKRKAACIQRRQNEASEPQASPVASGRRRGRPRHRES